MPQQRQQERQQQHFILDNISVILSQYPFSVNDWNKDFESITNGKRNLGVGLENLKNTCYFNACIQQFYHCHVFRERILNVWFSYFLYCHRFCFF